MVCEPWQTIPVAMKVPPATQRRVSLRIARWRTDKPASEADKLTDLQRVLETHLAAHKGDPQAQGDPAQLEMEPD